MTHAGRAFLAESRAIIALAEKASLSAGRVAHGDAGTVTVGFTASSGYRFLPGLIATCRKRLPDVDLALMRPQFANGDFDSLCVAQEPLVAALPENHALVRKTHGVRPAELFMAWRRDNDNPALKSVLDKCLDYYRPAPARVRSRGRD